MTCQTWCFVFNCFKICRAGQRGGGSDDLIMSFQRLKLDPTDFVKKTALGTSPAVVPIWGN